MLLDNNTSNIELPKVQVRNALSGTFNAQILSNGNIKARHEAQLYFHKNGIIEYIHVNNGDAVYAGQIIASLYNKVEQLNLLEANLQLAESKIELNDQLINQGGQAGDSNSVSPDIYSYLKIRSGYNRSRLLVQKSTIDFENTIIRAPFVGQIANLTLSYNNGAPVDKPLCTIINRKEIIARCYILESELSIVKVGQQALIIPISNSANSYKAVIKDINPIVTNMGLVNVTLKINNPDNNLLSGLNVRVIIHKPLHNQIIIPKSAVVERSGRKVVFTHVNGLAKWNYVDVGPENNSEIVVNGGLKEGDQVIISGNINLAHDTSIMIVQDQ